MPQPAYYNENANRSYPFVADNVSATVLDGNGLADAAIVDAGFMVGLSAGYVEGEHRIWLASVARDGSMLSFTFLSDAPGLVDKSLVFTRDLSSSPHELEFVEWDITEASISASVTTCEDTPWTGFLVTGDLSSLEDTLPDGDSITGEAYVEDALILNLAMSYVRSINVANADRTRVENPDGCKPICWPTDLQPLYVHSACLTGGIRFKPGFNSLIEQNNVDNTLTFSAQVGAGEGEPCEEVPLYTGELAPDGSTRLTGGPGCNDVIRSIGGAGGRVVDIIGGLGISVTADPANHKLIVNVDTHDMAVCFADSEEEESVACPEPEESTDPCDCGPAAEE